MLHTLKVSALGAWLALAWMTAPAAGTAIPVQLAIASRICCQPPSTKSTAADRKEVETLLRRGREALKSGKFETAESLLGRAESLNVEFSLFHLGDTPKKLRRDLEMRRDSQPQRPSQQFNPAAERAQADAPARQLPGQPNMGRQLGGDPQRRDRGLDPPDKDNESLPFLPKRDLALLKSPFSRPAVTDPEREAPGAEPEGAENQQGAAPALQTRRQSDSLLLNARRALAVGDVKRAAAAVEQAKRLKVSYGYHDDTPAKVESLVRKHTEVMEAYSRDNSNGSRSQYANLLMEEAQHLMRWKDFAEAERLATDASRLNVNYGPFDARPEALLTKIAAARKHVTGGQPATLTPEQMEAGAAKPLAEGAARSLATEDAGPKEQVLRLANQARQAIAAGNLEQADALVHKAEALKVPESAFGPKDDRPWMVALEIQKARYRGMPVSRASGSTAGAKNEVTQTLFDKNHDATRNRLASDELVAPEEAASEESGEDSPNALPESTPEELPQAANQSAAMQWFLEGEQALREQKNDEALDLFRKAYAARDQMDPVAAQRLQEHLRKLAAPSRKSAAAPPSLLENTTAQQQLLARQLSSDVGKQEVAARKMTEKEPKKARAMLQDARAKAEAAQVDAASKAQILRRVDKTLAEIDKYIAANREQIELDSHNKEVLEDIDRGRRVKVEVDDKIAKLVNEFNTLVDEERYAEAEIVAKRARQMDPDNPVVRQIVLMGNLIRRKEMNQSIASQKEQGMQDAWESTVESGIPFDDRNPIHFPDARKWKELSQTRAEQLAKSRTHMSEREVQIQRKLGTPVSLKFRDKPLTEVLDQLAKLAAVNLHLDPQGLAEEGVASDTPVTIDLTQDISLKSALNLILTPLHLSYVIKDEVLKITSEQLRDGHVYTMTYNVGDLVIPIPYFTSNSRMGLSGALGDAYGAMGVGNPGGFGGAAPMTVVASQGGGASGGVMNPAVLAQMNQLAGGAGGGSPQGLGSPVSFGGPGGVGGGAQADFDSLIELITTTIAPTTWDESGGPGSIKEFETNLSLVISQTQDVHEQIVDLLEQLRKNQDLQVTIEVRFITLNDNFFERIGVDFDFNIDDNVTINPFNLEDRGPSVTVGLEPEVPGEPFPNFTADLDIPFRQESFTLATPQFGQPVDVARFGFAILSDIEAYFLVAAAQGDRRSNVLQAPKVTLFNGQQAMVVDRTDTPFVISVIPVVGDFAAAQQPVIVVLSEGTFLTVQAVVTEDRRFVRLTVVPFFSQIGDVEEFTFSGSKTTTKGSSEETSGDDTTSTSEDETVTSEGVTVQLPSFSFVSVSTTVSVPDGGTVLLGGIKRLSEGRNEFGVPILSKLPYINRLFKNVGIGRETQSLMMMVTPRIIIQEEEEERLGIAPPPAP